jgi:hypothetical protein
VALLQHGDDSSVEPGDLLVRVFIAEAEEKPSSLKRTSDRDAGRTSRHARGENSAFRCRVLPGVVSQVGWTT